jgi:hypothetical protein
MKFEDLQRKLSLAGRHIFMTVNHDASQIKKKDVDPEVYILVDGKKHKLIEVGVLNQDIILETEKE